MKTKSTVRCFASYALAIAALVALLQAAPPVADAPLPAVDQAKQKVAAEIFAKVNAYEGPGFSRVGPRPTHRLEFQPDLLVKDEPRLHFAITPFRDGKLAVQLKGYVRLSDQTIFLIDPKNGEARPASEDPRFAPPLPAPPPVPAKAT